ncbi:MAG: homocysteine S-methyltransferase family protein, partial [Bacteriovoracaceae bacterium]|nr:homocysteine S-methyltransferase family protein [Bacteriovoracaceae bacterium]
MAKNTLISLPTCLAHTSRPLILDGGMGTVLQSFDLAAADFGGENYAGCFEYLALHNPAPLQKAHQAYLDAGADIIETCTFGASPIVLQEFGLAEQAYAINQANAQLAKSLASKASTPDKPRFVAGSLGPTTKSLTLQHLTFEEMVDNYYPQALGLYDGGIDYFLLETANDPLTLKAARIALKKVLREKHDPEFPVALSATFSGQQMLAGQDIRAYWAITQAWRPFYLGLNCITEGELPLLNFLLQHATCPVAVMPNNGLPNEHGQYAQTPARFLAQLKPFLNPPAGRGLKLVGGCCGTTPAHIKALAEYISLNFSSGDAWPTVDLPPKSAAPQHHPSVLAGTTWLNIDDLPRPIIAGERTKVLGAKSFREAVQKHDWAAAT